MLEALRKSANTWPIRILFVLLLIAFLSWGVGDMIRGWDRGRPAIQVGDRNISSQDVSSEYKREYDRLNQMFGGRLTPDMAKQFGLMDQTIERIVANAVLEETARKLDLIASNEVMRRHIGGIPAFQDQQGQFNAARFQQALIGAGLSEAGFVAMERGNLLRRQVASGVAAGIAAPKDLTESLYKYREERRQAEVINVSALSFPPPPAPGDAALEEFYKGKLDQFMAPEYRKVSAIVVRPGDVAKPENVTPEMVQEAYDRRKAEFSTPERRNVQQILLADDAEAGRARQLIDGGATIDTLARTVAAQPKQVSNLGWIDRSGLPGNIADSIFALPEGKLSEPVQSPFGWHVFRVTAIQAGSEKPMAEVRNQLVQDIALENARDDLYQTANALDDALASGAGIEEAAKRLSLKLVEIPAISAEGKDPSGKAVPNAPTDPRFTDLVFQTEQGSESAVTELEGGGYVVVHVYAVTPAQPKPFAEVKQEVLGNWQSAQRQQAAEKRANEIAEQLRKGETVEAVAKQVNLKVEKPAAFNRTAQNSGLPPAVVAELFRGNPGAIAMAPASGGAVVAKLVSIIPADAKADQAGFEATRSQIAQTMSQDLLEQFLAAQRKQFGVTVNRTLIDGPER